MCYWCVHCAARAICVIMCVFIVRLVAVIIHRCVIMPIRYRLLFTVVIFPPMDEPSDCDTLLCETYMWTKTRCSHCVVESEGKYNKITNESDLTLLMILLPHTSAWLWLSKNSSCYRIRTGWNMSREMELHLPPAVDPRKRLLLLCWRVTSLHQRQENVAQFLSFQLKFNAFPLHVEQMDTSYTG